MAIFYKRVAGGVIRTTITHSSNGISFEKKFLRTISPAEKAKRAARRAAFLARVKRDAWAFEPTAVEKAAIASYQRHLAACARQDKRIRMEAYASIRDTVRRNRCVRKLSSIESFAEPIIYDRLEVEESTLPEDDEVEVAEEATAWPEAKPVKSFRVRTERFVGGMLGQPLYTVPQYTPVSPPQWAILLMRRIRTLIREMQASRLAGSGGVLIPLRSMPSQTVYPELSQPRTCRYGDPQMESPSGDDAPVASQAGNVTLTETAAPDIATPISAPSLGTWAERSSTEVCQDYNYLTDRWLLLRTFEWTSIQQMDMEIQSIRLPFEAINGEAITCTRMSTTLPFTIHRYCETDIEIRVQVSANKFTCGQLQVSWLYEPDTDAEIGRRYNVWTLSQGLCGVVSAGANNEVVLYVPYRYHNSLMLCKGMNGYSAPLCMGILLIRVLAPLSSSEPVTTVLGNIFVRFPNAKFTGMLAGDIDKIEDWATPDRRVVDSQMFSGMASAAAMSLLNTMASDANRDKPPNFTPPLRVCPASSSSWCAGTNYVEPNFALRLNPHGQVPHPALGEDEMKISYVCQREGLIANFDWSTTQSAGTLLWSCNAGPIKDKSIYKKWIPTSAKLQMARYALPPVACVSALNAEFSGDTILRFSLVANAYYTGKIMVAFVPGVDYQDKVSLNQLRAGPHMIFDMQDCLEFEFVEPYISSNPWHKRLLRGHFDFPTLPSLGMIYVRIVNPLNAPASVANSIQVLVYHRGAPNFRVAVPAQPAIGLGADDILSEVQPTNFTEAIIGYWPYYAGGWHSFLGGDVMIYRYGGVSDHVAQFDYVVPGANLWAYCECRASGGLAVDGQTALFISFAVPYMLDGYKYLIPVRTLIEAKKIANLFALQNIKGDGSQLDPSKIKDVITPWSSATQSESHYTDGNVTWTVTQVAHTAERVGQMNSSVAQFSTNSSNVVDSSDFTFGESFTDLKDYCRRYQIMKILDLSGKIQDDGCSTFKLPIFPQGYKLNVGPPSAPYFVSNRSRNTLKQLIASFYKYGRGSQRLRLVFDKVEGLSVWVQHVPDALYLNQDVSFTTDLIHGDSVISHGYAMHLQALDVNNIVEVEIPYYLANPYIFVTRPKVGKHLPSTDIRARSTLGDLTVGFHVSKKVAIKTDIDCTVYHSDGDDFRYYGFQGMPPVTILDDLVAYKPPKSGDPQIGWLSGSLEKRAQNVIEKSADSFTDKVKDGINEVMGQVRETVTVFTDKWSSDNNFISNVMNAISQLVHVIINPTLGTIIWAITSFLGALLGIAWNMMSSLKDAVVNLYTKLFGTTKHTKVPISKVDDPQPSTSKGGDPQMADKKDEDPEWVGAVADFMSTITAGVSTYANLKDPKISALDNMTWAAQMRKEVSLASSMHLKFIASLKVVLRMVTWTIKKLFGWMNPNNWMLAALDGNSVLVKKWASEVVWLLDPSNEAEVLSSTYYYDRVYAAAFFADCLIAHAVDGTVRGVVEIRELWKKIREMRQRLYDIGRHPYVRAVPFAIDICGSGGIGKSHLMDDIAANFCEQHKLPVRNGLVYTHILGSKHWNGCTNQPVMLVDDKWVVGDEQSINDTISLIHMVMTNAPLNPPKAKVDDKEMRYAPDLLLMGSNHEWLEGIKNVRNHYAVLRRRDMLIRAQLRKEYYAPEDKEKTTNLLLTVDGKVPVEAKQIKNIHKLPPYCWLEFYENLTPAEKNDDWEGPFDYKELNQRILVASTKHRLHQQVRVQGYIDKIESMREDRSRVKPDEIAKTMLERNDNVRKYFDETCRKEDSGISAHQYEKYLELYNTWAKDDNNILHKTATIVAKDAIGETQMGGFEMWTEDDPFSLQNQREALFNDARDRADGVNKTKAPVHVALAFKGIVPMQKIYKECLQSWADLHDERKDAAHSLDNQIPAAYDKIKADLQAARYPDHYRCVIVKAFLAYAQCEHRTITPLADYDVQFKRFDLNGKTYSVDPCVGGFCPMADPFFLANFTALHIDNKPWVRKNYLTYSRDQLPEFMRRPGGYMSKLRAVGDRLILAIEWIQDNIWESISNVFGAVWRVGTKLLPWVLTAFTMYFGISSLRTLQSPVPVEIVAKSSDSQMIPSGDVVTRKAPKMSVPIVKSGDPNMSQKACDVRRRVRENTIFIEALDGDAVHSGRCLILGDRICLIIRHYDDIFRNLSDKAVFWIRNGWKDDASKVPFDYRAYCKYIKYFSYPGTEGHSSNLGYFELPARIPQRKSLLQHIAKSMDHARSGCWGSVISPGGEDYLMQRISMDNVSYIVRQNSFGAERVVLDKVYTYVPNYAGMCGSILMSESLDAPIIGIHVAGGGGEGASEILCAEMFANMPLKQRMMDIAEPEFDEETLEEDGLTIETAVFPRARVAARFKQHASGKTRTVPSELHEVLPVTTGPSIISKLDPRNPAGQDPLKDGVSKHGLVPRCMNPDILYRCYVDLTEKIQSVCLPIRGEVGKLSLQLAVCGDSSLPFYEPLKWDTSPGHPFVADRPAGVSGKKYLFTLEETQNGYKLIDLDPQLRKVLALKENLRKQFKRPTTIFTDCLKDSRLPLDKITIPGKTRIFSISPVDYTIQFRQYVGDFMSAYQVARTKAEHAIGMNIFSNEWTQLARYLQQKGSKVVIGDYKNFGPGLLLECARYAIQIIKDWYRRNGCDEAFGDMIEVLGSELLNSYHLADNLIYQVMAGIPSGSPVTAILNSLVNSLYCRYVWLKAMQGTEYCTLAAFHQHGNLVTYGDDLAWNISDEIAEIFNAEVMQKEFRILDIGFTDALKVEPIRKYVTLESVSFLKHKFEPHPSRVGSYTAALDKDSIQDIVSWIHKDNDPIEASRVNAIACVESAYGWGPKYYNSIRTIISSAWATRFHEQLVTRTWSELDALYLGN